MKYMVTWYENDHTEARVFDTYDEADTCAYGVFKRLDGDCIIKIYESWQVVDSDTGFILAEGFNLIDEWQGER